MNTFILIFFVILSVRRPTHALHNLEICHFDYNLKPKDGLVPINTFGWLGFVLYTHVTTGLPHHSKAPRVVLIHRQFVIGTALDLLHLPNNYELGNVIFGEYEREEDDCGLTLNQLKMGLRCPNAYMEIALLDIIPHPEYSSFGVENSLALGKLMRPIKSDYMLPVCLPSITERNKKMDNESVFMVDYVSIVPQDFDAERMGKKSLKMYTHEECNRHRSLKDLDRESLSHMLCSSGCGVRAGTPIVKHSSEGAFELIVTVLGMLFENALNVVFSAGVAAGGASCVKQSMRRRFISDPPVYIDVYPYNTWIVNVITASVLPLAYPQSFRRTVSGSTIGLKEDPIKKKKKIKKIGWSGRDYLAGRSCFKRPAHLKRKAVIFYHEKFEVVAKDLGMLHVQLKVSAGIECMIACARLSLPNKFVTPIIQGIGRYNITIDFITEKFPTKFLFTLVLWGRNSTRALFESWVEERNEGHW